MLGRIIIFFSCGLQLKGIFVLNVTVFISDKSKMDMFKRGRGLFKSTVASPHGPRLLESDWRRNLCLTINEAQRASYFKVQVHCILHLFSVDKWNLTIQLTPLHS